MIFVLLWISVWGTCGIIRWQDGKKWYLWCISARKGGFIKIMGSLLLTMQCRIYIGFALAVNRMAFVDISDALGRKSGRFLKLAFRIQGKANYSLDYLHPDTDLAFPCTFPFLFGICCLFGLFFLKEDLQCSCSWKLFREYLFYFSKYKGKCSSNFGLAGSVWNVDGGSESWKARLPAPKIWRRNRTNKILLLAGKGKIREKIR